jgi:hypothetical protein
MEDLIELKKLSEMQDLSLLQDCINSKHAHLYKEIDNVYGGAPKVMAIGIQYESFLQVIDDYAIFVPKIKIQL